MTSLATPAPNVRRNRWCFALGTLGRDMVYALTSMWLILYLSQVVRVSNATLAWLSGLILAVRLLDAVNDFLIGAVVDNTRTRWGPYKPWIAGGMVVSGAVTIVLFSDLGGTGPVDGPPAWGFIGLFTVVYVAWSLSFSANDIPYWSLVPALSVNQIERERMSSLAKVFATIGLFTVMVGVLPITAALGGGVRAWTVFTAGVVAIMVAGQLVTLLGVRQERLIVPRKQMAPREVFDAIARNDQLLWTALAMVLFQTGYVTTTSFGAPFFTYVYGDEGMYTPFAAVLGVGMVLGFVLFPVARRRFTRRQLYTGSMATIVAGYVIFFLSPMNIWIIGLCGLMLFVADSFIVILMIGFITDCVEYGQWKLGHRNGAVTFAIQPFINQVGGAIAQAILGVTLILTGINGARSPEDVGEAGLWGMKVMMLPVPALLIIASYLIYRTKYRIDEAKHARIVADLKERGELAHDVA